MASVVARYNPLAGRRFLARFKDAFTRRPNGTSWPKRERTWKHAGQYFRALLRPGRRKSITGLACRVNAESERLERFVRESPWEHDEVEDHLRTAVPEGVEGPEAAIIVDGMGIPKQGKHSVGVARQWCGATGNIDNCQVIVNCTLARPGQERNADQVTWPLGSQLYLTKKWAGIESEYDDQREREHFAQLREGAAIPDEVEYQPKYDIAADLIEDALDAGIEHACVIADANYGMRSAFRDRLRDLGESYVLEVETGRPYFVSEDLDIVEPGPTPGRGRARKYRTIPDGVDPKSGGDIAEELYDDVWAEVTWNQGTKGELSGSFYRRRVRVVSNANQRRVEDETGWVLLQRDHGAGWTEGGGELKVWVCWGLDDASLEELVKWAHLRWTIEQFHKHIKQLLGADEFQGRTWRGFHHHIAVVLLAQAFIAEQRLETGEEFGGFDSFEKVARELVRIAAIQRLMDEHGFDRDTAEEVGVDMLKGLSEWG